MAWRGKASVPVAPGMTPKMKAFLDAFSTSCSLHAAAKKSGINRGTHYNWMETCPEYVKAFETCKRIAAEAIEDYAIERAVNGWNEKVFFEGAHVDDQPRYETALLIFLLKGLMPEKYARKMIDPAGAAANTPVQAQIEVTFVRPDAEIQSVRALPQLPPVNGDSSNGGGNH